ncbi:phosphatidylinositol-3,4-bisphosphate 4-phosphatase [Aureococcus anophagefferens]|uniref:Phosphatidylinositol-3,4-bisphosphate 4-phosphatase n=2 Tax=Aureococcus anophagefferens TaxID=44056 RepID=A0ABR1G4E0_AURAN
MRSRELDFAATKIEAIADQLAAMRDELEAQAAHADDVYASGRARALDLRVAAPFPESPGGVAAVENPLARGGHRLKRSTLKKDAALQFLPTNLNWHQLRARRQPDHPHDAARTSNLQPDFNVTFGATAAHAKHLGFRDGGLQKLVDRSEAYVDGGDAAASSTRRRALAHAGDRAARAAPTPRASRRSRRTSRAGAISLASSRAGDAPPRPRADAELAAWAAALRGAVAPAVADGTPGKNVHVLLHSSDLLRDLAGSHAICCKSGKDRTAMAVTLEQTRALSRDLRVFDERMLCKLLRAHGVRRRNLLLNTGQDKYAFNAVQVKSLPVCYRPPAGTYTGNALT